MNLQDAIRDVCLHKPFEAPFPVPVHQETVTKKHLDREIIRACIKFPHETALHNYYIDRNPIHQPAVREVYESLRAFSANRKIEFVTAKAPEKNLKQSDLTELYRGLSVTHSHVTQRGDFYALDIMLSRPVPEGKARFEPTVGEHHLTIQKGKHRSSFDPNNFKTNFSFDFSDDPLLNNPLSSEPDNQ